jgi:hypothetical protein
MDQNNNAVDNEQQGTTREVVDGFSDDPNAQGEQGPDAADPGTHTRIEPMGADERARAEQEIREDEREGHASGDEQ